MCLTTTTMECITTVHTTDYNLLWFKTLKQHNFFIFYEPLMQKIPLYIMQLPCLDNLISLSLSLAGGGERERESEQQKT